MKNITKIIKDINSKVKTYINTTVEKIDDMLPRWVYWHFYKHVYYHIKMSLWGLFKFMKISTKMVPWDYSSILMMLEFQLTILKHSLATGHEDKESLDIKLAHMERAIFLLKHIIEDDYVSLVMPDYHELNNVKIVKTDAINGKECYTVGFVGSETLHKKLKDASVTANKLYIQEWNEFWNILRGDMDNNIWGLNVWWD